MIPSPSAHVRLLVAAGVPSSFFGRRIRAPRTATDRAEQDGFQAGRGNRHYMAELTYRTSAEWLAFLRGWRRGQVEFKRREI